MPSRASTTPASRVYRDKLGFSLRRHYVDQFHYQQIPTIPPGSRVVDLGGHKSTKRGDFDIRQFDLDVVCVNRSAEKGADVIADAADLPFAANTFDAALCSELLEHVPDPRRVIAEAHRVLKPGGVLLVCTPFLYHLHADPYDFGRYTDYFWQQTLAEAGFQQVDIKPQGRFWSVVVDMFREAAYQLDQQRQPRFKPIRLLIKQGMGIAKRCAVAWDQRPSHPVFHRFTTGFGIRAHKAA